MCLSMKEGSIAQLLKTTSGIFRPVYDLAQTIEIKFYATEIFRYSKCVLRGEIRMIRQCSDTRVFLKQ